MQVNFSIFTFLWIFCYCS